MFHVKHYERGWSEVLVESTLFGVRDKVKDALDMLHEFEPEERNWMCPKCRALGGDVIAGKEFYVDSIEIATLEAS